MQIDCTIESYLCTRSWTLIEKGWDYSIFYFQAAFQTAKRKRIVTQVIIHPQTMKIMLVAMKMVMMTVAANMIVLMKTIMIVVIAIVMSMKALRMMSAMTIIAIGSNLLKMDYSHYNNVI